MYVKWIPELTDEEVEKLHAFLRWKHGEVVRKTMENTTHPAKLENRLPMRRHIKIRHPQLNVPKLQEMWSTDTMFASVRSCEGYSAAQMFDGRKSGRKIVYVLRTESQAHQAMEDFIRDVRSPYCLHSYNAMAETGRVWNSLMRKYNVKHTTSEP